MATALLQRQDIADIRRLDERVDQRQLGCSGVAKHVACALAPEHFQKDRCAAALIPLIRHDLYSFASGNVAYRTVFGPLMPPIRTMPPICDRGATNVLPIVGT
jgi:hypothetical protein